MFKKSIFVPHGREFGKKKSARGCRPVAGRLCGHPHRKPSEDRVVFDDESLSINPLDKQIIARALSENAEVQTLTVFSSAGEKALRYAAALGVNAVARIDAPAQDAFTAAAHFAAYLGYNPASLVLCGEASWDFATGEFPHYLSALTGIGLVENVSGFSFAPDGLLTVLRQADDREQELNVKLPVILSCNKSIFPPEEVRIPSMREMMLALRFPIQVIPPSESPEPKKYFSNYGYTPRRPAVRFFREEGLRGTGRPAPFGFERKAGR